MESQINLIKDDIKDIRDNHLAHIQEDVSVLKTQQAVQGTDIKWLKKFFFIVATASIGSLVAAVINLL